MIPQFEALFKGFGADLPAFTQMVIDLSRFVQSEGIFIAVVVGGAFWTFFYFKKRSRKMREIPRPSSRSKFPIIGPILNKSAIARYARTLSTMFAAGVPLVEALESVAGATGNIVYEDAVMKMRDEVATGQRLQRAMENTGLFPNMVIQMIAVGEESGSLDAMSAQGRHVLRGGGRQRGRLHVEPARAADHGDPGRARRRPGHRDVPADLQAGLGRLTTLPRPRHA